MSLVVNDVHSKLNATRVARVLEPARIDELRQMVCAARAAGVQLSICGSRHAMGGQQFGEGTWLIDMRRRAGIAAFDEERGLITVGAGIEWPELIASTSQRAAAGGRAWSIRQKQTGADRLTVGGALSANVHGRGLRMPPIVSDVEAFTMVDASGDVRCCSRTENAELFALAIGGYGLFGIIAEVTLRLMPRVKVERRVEVLSLEELIRVPEERDTSEWMFGDFQFSIDERARDFLQRGVFSAYARVNDETRIVPEERHLGAADWMRLLHLAHADRARVFEEYADYYRSTDRQLYWSDTHQLGTYLEGYHAELDRRLGATHPGSEMITELYVPRAGLSAFMAAAAELLRRAGVPVIYGTVRLIEQDEESFLPWARERWACIIFNLHLEHTPAGLDLGATTFREMIDVALGCGGSFYLTYHRWASRAQVEAAYPRFVEFLQRKHAHDPEELWTSEWYRHYRRAFAE